MAVILAGRKNRRDIRNAGNGFREMVSRRGGRISGCEFDRQCIRVTSHKSESHAGRRNPCADIP
jgi:hypothetical protein